MKVGELFVNLGVKGAEKTVGALAGVGKGMGEIKSMSLETKAAIVGVFYGLERLMAHSAALGNSLSQNSALLGISAKTLQQWQFAGIQAGDTAEGVISSIKGINAAMSELYVGGGPAEYLGLVGERLLGKGGFDVNRAMKDPLYVLERLQALAQDKSIPTGVLTKIMQSFGIGEGTNVALRKGAFNDSNFARASSVAISDEQVAKLQKVQAMWADLELHIQKLFANFTTRHGAKLIGELEQIATGVGRLVGDLDDLAQRLGVFEAIAKLINVFSEAAESKPGTIFGEKHLEKKIWNSLVESIFNPGAAEDRLQRQINASLPVGAGGTASKSVTIHQNVTHYGDAKDTAAVARTHKQAIVNAAKQSFAQTQAN